MPTPHQPEFTFHGDCHIPNIALVLIRIRHTKSEDQIIQVAKTGHIKHGTKLSAASSIPTQFHPDYVYRSPLRNAIDAKGWSHQDSYVDVWCHEPLDTLLTQQGLNLAEIHLVAVAAARRCHHRLFEQGHETIPFRANAMAPPPHAAAHIWPLTRSFLHFANTIL